MALVQKAVQYLEEYYAVMDTDTNTCMPRPQQISWVPPQGLVYKVRIYIPCNTSNPSLPFNPMAPYLDTSPVQASNPYALLFSTEFLSHSPSAPLSQPRLHLHHSLNIHACSLPLPQPCRHHFLHTQLKPINKNKEKTASEIPTPKHAHLF